MYSTRALSARNLAMLPTRRYKRTLATAASASAISTSKTATTRLPIHVRLWRSYQSNLECRPLLTKAFMASFIFFASDSATQYVMPGKSNLKSPEAPGASMVWQWDPSRALSGAGFGVVATCWLHYWWGMLEVTLGRAIPAQRYRLANTMVKVAVDQLLGKCVCVPMCDLSK